jgi:hypothetical protein
MAKIEERLDGLLDRTRDLQPLTREIIELKGTVREVQRDVQEINAGISGRLKETQEDQRSQKVLAFGLLAAVITGTVSILAAILSGTGHA